MALERALGAAASLEGLLPEAEAWGQRARRAVRGRESATATSGGGGFQGPPPGLAGEGFGNLRAAVGAAVGVAKAAARVDLSALEPQHNETVVALVARGRAVLAEATAAARAQSQLALAGLDWPPSLSGKAGCAAPAFGDPTAGEVRDLIECLGGLRACQAADKLLGAVAGSGGAGELWPEEEGGEAGAGGVSAAVQVPVSWAAEEMALGLRLRLDYHFGRDEQGYRIDKPEWALNYSLKAARAMRDAVLPLEASLPGLAQAVALAAGAVTSEWLSGTLLPRILEMCVDVPARDQYLLHTADEAVNFDRQVLGAALGVDVEATFGAEPTSPMALWGFGRCLGAFLDGPAAAAWLDAEYREATRRLDSFISAADAWVLGSGSGNTAGDTAGEGEGSWDLGETFCPSAEVLAPKCAQDVVFLFESLTGRCMSLLRPRHYEAFMEGVFCPAFKHFADRMGRRLQSFGVLGPLCEPAPVEGLGLCLCLLEYVEYELAELTELPFFTEAEAVVASQVGGWLGPMVGHLSELRATWADKVSRAAVQRFDATSSKYRVEASRFRGEPRNFAHGEATDSLQLPLQQLREVLDLLRAHFPRSTFRRVWRAMARAVHESILDSVPYRGIFSATGAQQYRRDCELLVALFAPYAPNPAVYFRDLLETCRVLELPAADAAAFARSLTAASASAASHPAGACTGYEVLGPEQITWLLERRLDFRA